MNRARNPSDRIRVVVRVELQILLCEDAAEAINARRTATQHEANVGDEMSNRGRTSKVTTRTAEQIDAQSEAMRLDQEYARIEQWKYDWIEELADERRRSIGRRD